MLLLCWTEIESTKKYLDLSKEVLWVFVGQRVAELRAVKVEGKKNSVVAGEEGSNRAERQNFFTSIFDSP